MERQEQVIGAYAPRPTPYEYVFPAQYYPSGFFARGSYSAECKVVDDDKSLHVRFKYLFNIAKDWTE